MPSSKLSTQSSADDSGTNVNESMVLMVPASPKTPALEASATGGTIQISMEAFHSLLAAVDTLKLNMALAEKHNQGLSAKVQELDQSVTLVRQQNKSLQLEVKNMDRQLLAAQENSGVPFCRFSRLPLELRRKIFRSALSEPRVVVLRHRFDKAVGHLFLPVGNQPALLSACEASRTEALQLQHNLYAPSENRSQEESDSLPKIYINGDVDTVWYLVHSDSGGKDDFYPNERMDRKMRQAWTCNHVSLSSTLKPIAPLKFAISWAMWEWFCTYGLQSFSVFMDMLMEIGVRELTLVLGYTAAAAADDDVIFVEPRNNMDWKLKKILSFEIDNFAPFTRELLRRRDNPSWSLLEAESLALMKNFQAARARLRYFLLPQNVNIVPGDFASGGRFFHVRDMSGWTVTSIRCVEAISRKEMATIST
ncbi:uncharacterized protein LY89DRAFT_731485 [Mollisia scopiformis]|uniref:2EXR domain-containing protein n=1 Tax=Mollisia scopiformis TaxID=149040 RepID=A0A194XFZ3_MOLSC|nr:uncharacterized protein LY89DRAFT_731485 [Mollisia scopiformis]KUJ19061.1 hypothetical protein LY89DRAFT_731485 [Mollisia scopiformis]